MWKSIKKVPSRSHREKRKGVSSVRVYLTVGCLIGFLQVYLDQGNEAGRLLATISMLLGHDSIITGGRQTDLQSPPNPEVSQQLASADIRDSLLRFSAESIWEGLLQEASALMRYPGLRGQQQQPKIALEVGMYRAKQCLQAAHEGLEAYCVEPSPSNFQRVKADVQKEPSEIQDRVHLLHRAAGDRSGLLLNFTAAGGTGDHVGVYDVWNMKAGRPVDEELRKKVGEPIQVSSLRLDDLLDNAIPAHTHDNIFLLKIDTQGYEPSVFAGLENNVFQQPRVDYILFEYWPKGMDLMTTGDTESKACVAAKLLQSLQKAGYVLYALPNTSHVRAPVEAKKALREERAPLQHIQENCMYYYQIEERFPDPEYKMGYWSDILAVAPNASLVPNPVTEIGQILQRQQ